MREVISPRQAGFLVLNAVLGVGVLLLRLSSFVALSDLLVWLTVLPAW